MSDDPVHDAALVALVENVRGLVERVVRSHASTERIQSLNDEVRALCESLDPHTRAAGPSELPRVYHAREPHRFLPRNMVSGHLNPLAPPVQVEILDDQINLPVKNRTVIVHYSDGTTLPVVTDQNGIASVCVRPGQTFTIEVPDIHTLSSETHVPR